MSNQNPYKTHLDLLFNRVIDLRHTVSRINIVLKNDVKLVSNKEIKVISGSALIISDWTGPTDEGWEINFHTGARRATLKENYNIEVKRIISNECCLAYAQAFEALEKYLKNCVFQKLQNNVEFRKTIGYDEKIARGRMPGGDELFKLVKKACGEYYQKFTHENNKNVKFKQFWTIISEVRHAITHSDCNISMSRISKSSYHFAAFEHLFNYSVIDDKTLHIELDYKGLERALKYIAEFSYQIYKCLSICDKLSWEYISHK